MKKTIKKEFDLGAINEAVTTSKKVIKNEKASIEVNIRETLVNTLNDIKQLKGENNLITKKDAVKVIKERYNAINNIDKDLKNIMLKVCDYIYLGINIKLEEVTNNQFKTIISLFNKLSASPKTKNGTVNKSYVSGLENVVNARLLNNCTTTEMYKEFINNAQSYIEANKQ